MLAFARLDALHELELERLRAMHEAGMEIAVPAAMFYCCKYQEPIPEWVQMASTKMIIRNLAGRTGRTGRASGIISSYRQTKIHAARHETVLEIRGWRERYVAAMSELEPVRSRRAAKLRSDIAKLQDWIGTNNDSAFDCATFLLKRSRARGKPSVMKRSFEMVQKESQDPKLAHKYLVLDPQFDRLVGADIKLSFSAETMSELINERLFLT